MTIPMTAAWAIIAILCTWFVMSCFYDMRIHRQQKRIAKLEHDLALADFKLNRRDAVREDFEKECG